MALLKPPKLSPGDTIGVVSPCLPVLPSFRDNYERGKQQLRDMGFQLKEGKTIGLQHWYSAGTPQEQAGDINAMFADPEVKAIVATSGGHSAISVLELLDYDLIRQHPKPFIGMSDMTCYHLALYAQTGLVGFHMDEVIFGLGMNGSQVVAETNATITKAYINVLTKDTPIGTLPHLTKWDAWREGQAVGHLIGGNLNSMTYQMGTPYFPKPEMFDGAILFWESVGQPKYNILRSLYQLKYYGALERISGMCIGTITDVPPVSDKELTEPSVKDIVLDITKEYDFPVMAGMDFGHYTPNIPMPIGIRAKFDTAKLELRLLEGAVDG